MTTLVAIVLALATIVAALYVSSGGVPKAVVFNLVGQEVTHNDYLLGLSAVGTPPDPYVFGRVWFDQQAPLWLQKFLYRGSEVVDAYKAIANKKR